MTEADQGSEPTELWEVPWRTDEPGGVPEWKEAARGRKRTTAKTKTGVGRTDQWWKRNPAEEEYSGGTDDGVSGVWEIDRRDAWKVCEGDICVWRWTGGGGVEILMYMLQYSWYNGYKKIIWRIRRRRYQNIVIQKKFL